MIKKSASKWLSLATITILGQPPRNRCLILSKVFSSKAASKNSEFAQMQGAEKILQHSSWDEIWIFRGARKKHKREINDL